MAIHTEKEFLETFKVGDESCPNCGISYKGEVE